MGYCCGCGCSGRGDGDGDGSGGSGSGSGGHSCNTCTCCCCDMSGLGIIDGMRMTRYRMTTSSNTGRVGISRGNPSGPSPGTSNSCKPHTSHCRTTVCLSYVHSSYIGLDRYDIDGESTMIIKSTMIAWPYTNVKKIHI